MRNRVMIYVPSTRGVTQALDAGTAREYIERTIRFLAQFGGATAIAAEGAWPSATGEIVNESVTLVFAFISSLTPEIEDMLFQFCEQLRDELGQEAIALEINGELFLI